MARRSWNFVIWGSIHGGLLALSRMTLDTRDSIYQRLRVPDRMRDVIRIVITFHLVCFAWIFFRADSLDASIQIVTSFFTESWSMPFLPIRTGINSAIGLGILLSIEFVQYRSRDPKALLDSIPTPLRIAGWTALIFAIILLGVEEGAQFIYFQF